MVRNFIKSSKIPLLISLVSYLLFFHTLLDPKALIWGDDLRYFYYPVRTFLWQSLQDGVFPFWTERMFSGFPIYSEVETSFLNPLNSLSVLLLGPFLSYKFIHILLYLSGSLSLYFLLKRFGFGLLSFAVSNFIYFFNFALLYHQDHQNIIFISYLIPVNLLMASLFIEKMKLEILLLNSLVISLGIYFGSMQTVVMSLIAETLFFIIFAIGRIKLSKILLNLSMLLFFVMVETLPIIYPALALMQKSGRVSEEFSYRKGSLLPLMAVLPFYPDIFNRGSEFEGHGISDDYHEHEIYIYWGITASVMAAASLLFLRNSRFKVFAFSLLVVFLFLGFLRSIPLTDVVPLPVVSMFRYWVRSSILGSLGISLLAGASIKMLENSDIKVERRNWLFLLGPIAYMLVLVLINLGHKEMNRILRFFAKGEFDFSSGFFDWSFYLLSALVIVVVLIRNRVLTHRKFLVITLAGLLMLDLFFAGRGILRFIRSEEIPILEQTPDFLDSRRVIRDDEEIFGNESLYYKQWWLFGYSQLLDRKYSEHLKNLGFLYVKRPSDISTIDRTSLREMGVYAVQKENETEILYASGDLDLFPGETGAILERKEGRIKAQIENSDSIIRTAIRNYPGWTAYVNSIRTPLSVSQDLLYLHLPTSPGTHIVELKYVPIFFHKGLSLSILAVIILYIYSGALRKLVEN